MSGSSPSTALGAGEGEEVSEAIVGSTVKAHCGRCGGTRNCQVKGFHSDGASEEDGSYWWQTDWYLLVCCGCEFSFAQTISTDSETIHHGEDQDGNYSPEPIEEIELWPAKATRKRPEWFQHHRVEGTPRLKKEAINIAMNELYRSLDAGLMVLSSIGIRTAFDAACEALGIESGLQFAKKLKSLVDEGKIRASESEKLSVLIDAGSAAAHRGWEPESEQLDVQMDILEEFIFNSVVLPSREKKKADKIDRLKKAVPPKHKPKKKPPAENEGA